MKIEVLNGANINMLGIREPEIYGKESYRDLVGKIKRHAKEKNIKVKIRQTNSEGELIDMVQKCRKKADGIIINPGGYTHTSVALGDALAAVKDKVAAVEVHISDISQREDYRKISFIKEHCIASVVGKGTDGYLEAMDILSEKVR